MVRFTRPVPLGLVTTWPTVLVTLRMNPLGPAGALALLRSRLIGMRHLALLLMMILGTLLAVEVIIGRLYVTVLKPMTLSGLQTDG